MLKMPPGFWALVVLVAVSNPLEPLLAAQSTIR
jgi:hypothetical protein